MVKLRASTLLKTKYEKHRSEIHTNDGSYHIVVEAITVGHCGLVLISTIKLCLTRQMVRGYDQLEHYLIGIAASD